MRNLKYGVATRSKRLAHSSPCGRPPLQRPTRVLRAAPCARELSYRRLCSEERPPAALWCLPKLTGDSTASSPTPPPLCCAGSLAFLIVQNSSHVLLLRYSRICEGECKEYTVRRSRLQQKLRL